jgi:hypothetical protein
MQAKPKVPGRREGANNKSNFQVVKKGPLLGQDSSIVKTLLDIFPEVFQCGVPGYQMDE